MGTSTKDQKLQKEKREKKIVERTLSKKLSKK